MRNFLLMVYNAFLGRLILVLILLMMAIVGLFFPQKVLDIIAEGTG